MPTKRAVISQEAAVAMLDTLLDVKIHLLAFSHYLSEAGREESAKTVFTAYDKCRKAISKARAKA